MTTRELDPAGPAALIERATGERPLWANAETQTEFEGQPWWEYEVRYAGHDVVRQLGALTDHGWTVTVRSAPGWRLSIMAARGQAA